MRCDEARELIGAFIDGEASHAKAQALRDHTGSCASCEDVLTDFGRMSQQLRRLGRVSAPARLKSRLHAALAAEGTRSLRVRMPSQLPQAATLAAACLVSILLTAVITWAVMRHQADSARLDQEVVTAHIRSLLQDSPIQMASSDPHTVRPWFNGRVEFAPAVKDLVAEGFRLMGARLDYLGGRRVGALVYMRRMHVINVFIWPSPTLEEGVQRLNQINGYNLVYWNRGGLAYWAVSDLNANELRQLQTLL
jgi:anti-sigma factor RsiW